MRKLGYPASKISFHCTGWAFDINVKTLPDSPRIILVNILHDLEMKGIIHLLDERVINGCLHVAVNPQGRMRGRNKINKNEVKCNVGGSIGGKYAILDAVYHPYGEMLVLKLKDYARPHTSKVLRIKATRAPPAVIGNLLSEIKISSSHNFVREIIDWYVTSFQIKTFRNLGYYTLILEENIEGILGVGTRNIIALSRDLITNPVALFHEIAEAYFRVNPAIAMSRILAALNVKKGKVSHRKIWVESKGFNPVHYWLRTFQRKVFGYKDVYLTQKIKEIGVRAVSYTHLTLPTKA